LKDTGKNGPWLQGQIMEWVDLGLKRLEDRMGAKPTLRGPFPKKLVRLWHEKQGGPLTAVGCHIFDRVGAKLPSWRTVSEEARPALA
jgi:hypothetical protein